MEDIFQDDSTIPESNWWAKDKVGDSIQGVLVEEPRYNQPSRFGIQNVYTLETEEGRIVMVGLNPTSNKRAVSHMLLAEVGDVVGFKFTSEYDSGKGNPGKNIDVRIKHLGKEVAHQNIPTGPVTPTPQPKPTQPVLTEKEQKIVKIIDLAVLKLGATRADARLKIIEATGVALTEENVDSVYAAMVMLK